MTQQRPRLLLVKGTQAHPEELVRSLSEQFEVMEVDAAGLKQISPRGVFGAASQGYDLVLMETGALTSGNAGSASGGTPTFPGGVPEGEAAGRLAAIGEGVCICTLEGSLLWANDRFKAFDDQTRARITAVCRR